MERGTIVRTIALAVTWINLLLTQYGLNPIPVLDEGYIAAGVTLIVSIWTWFKNNYITAKGRRQEVILRKAGVK